MKDKDLDNILREKLNQIAISPTLGAWEAFEHRYDSESDFDTLAEEIHFDNHVAEKSNNISTNLPPQWPLLQNDLTIIDNRRRAVWHYKAMETVLVCFIIYAISLVPHEMLINKSGPTVPLKHNPDEFAQNDSKSSNQRHVGLDENQNKSNPQNSISQLQPKSIEDGSSGLISTYENKEISKTELNFVVTDELPAHEINLARSLSEFINNEVSTVQKSELQQISVAPSPNHSIHSYLESSTTSDEVISSTTSDEMISSTTSDEVISSTISDEVISEGSLTQSITAIASVDKIGTINHNMLISRPEIKLDLAVLPLISPHPTSEYALSFPIVAAYIKPSARYLASVWASRDINLINTPFDKIYSLASYQKEALNYSFGANLSRKQGRMDVSTGIEYAKRTYQPKPFTEKYGTADTYYFESSLNKISYDILTVPLKLKYDYISKKKWSAYAMVGAALNLIVNAAYKITDQRVLGSPENNFQLSPTNDPRLDEKNFISGIGSYDKLAGLTRVKGISSNSFNDNYFVGLTLGFGIEKKLSPLSSIYVEPSYHRHIFSNDIGIGPNKDKIHTSSLQFGFRTMLL